MNNNSGKKGNLTEVLVMAELLRYGLNVSIPYGGHTRYDLVVDIEGRLLKVQVKAPQFRKNRPNLIRIPIMTHPHQSSSRRREPHRYDRCEVDLFATIWEGVCYLLIPTSQKTEICLRAGKPKKKMQRQIGHIEEFTIPKVIKRMFGIELRELEFSSLPHKWN